MTEYRLDACDLFTREAMHRALGELLDFPHWYGRNLDALFDCLTDLGRDTRLIVVHSVCLGVNLGEYGKRVRQVMETAAAENPHFQVCFL